MKKLFYCILFFIINLANLNSKDLLELRNSTRRELKGSINFEISSRFRKTREISKKFIIAPNDINQLSFFKINIIKKINIEYDGQIRVFNINYSRKNPQLSGLPLTFTFVEDGEFIHIEYQNDHGEKVIVNGEKSKSSSIVKSIKILLENETGREVSGLVKFDPGPVVKRYNIKAKNVIELESPVNSKIFKLSTITILDSGKQRIFDINFSNKPAIKNPALSDLPMIFKIINRNGFYFIKYKNYHGEFITVPESVETEVQLINRTSNKLNISLVFAVMTRKIKKIIKNFTIKPKQIYKSLLPKQVFGIKRIAIKLPEGTKVFNINFFKPDMLELEKDPSLNGLPMIFYITEGPDGFHIKYEDRQQKLVVVNQFKEIKNRQQTKRQSRMFEGAVAEGVWEEGSDFPEEYVPEKR